MRPDLLNFVKADQCNRNSKKINFLVPPLYFWNYNKTLITLILQKIHSKCLFSITLVEPQFRDDSNVLLVHYHLTPWRQFHKLEHVSSYVFGPLSLVQFVMCFWDISDAILIWLWPPLYWKGDIKSGKFSI